MGKITRMTVEELEVKIRQARHNSNRQRRREEAGRDTLVSSSFWEQVERDYRRMLREQKEAVEVNLWRGAGKRIREGA